LFRRENPQRRFIGELAAPRKHNVFSSPNLLLRENATSLRRPTCCSAKTQRLFIGRFVLREEISTSFHRPTCCSAKTQRLFIGELVAPRKHNVFSTVDSLLREKYNVF